MSIFPASVIAIPLPFLPQRRLERLYAFRELVEVRETGRFLGDARALANGKPPGSRSGVGACTLGLRAPGDTASSAKSKRPPQAHRAGCFRRLAVYGRPRIPTQAAMIVCAPMRTL